MFEIERVNCNSFRVVILATCFHIRSAMNIGSWNPNCIFCKVSQLSFIGKIDVKIEVKINLKDLDHHDYAKQIVAAL